MDWHKKTVSETLKGLETNLENGLSTDDAGKRLERFGPNALPEKQRESRLLKFLKTFTEFIILVLIGAAVISGVLGEWVDSAAILSIVLLNGIIGFLQEEKAERVMEALKKLSAPAARVIRDGTISTIASRELVPGDIALLEAGDKVPADCRIIDARFLKIEEAALTGESHAVEKDTKELGNDLPLGDRINMAYLGTTVVYGRGSAVVADTGSSTEMGKIARMLEESKPEPTPLQRSLKEFARLLVYGAAIVCGIIFLIGVLRGEDVITMFLTAVSLAVAAIPEGLPAVVTIVLAIGVQRMVKRHALIRKLPSVETLGSATIIASDKTGTLTQNQMTVKRLYLPAGDVLDVTGGGYAPLGGFFAGTHEVSPKDNPAIMFALKAALLCNSAELKNIGPDDWTIAGDPTEGSLITLGLKAGLTKKDALKGLEFAGELPFDSERKMMTVVFRDNNGVFHAFIKGAPERILPLCAYLNDGQGLTDADRGRILKANDDFSKDALRVLALAYRPFTSLPDLSRFSLIEKDLTFLALTGLMDPPREEVFAAIKKSIGAGITPIMITGDHKITAIAIAREIGAFGETDLAITGAELDGMGDEEFKRQLARIKVYARVNPEHKLKIVKAWKERGATIAMTGDGVNDAPAVKEADIGISMGITGTDVTKEASDMVLTDDNFASIVSAVEEGRGIFDNIKRVVHFLLSCNIGEVLVLFIASIAGMPLPLLPIQILWTNLVTDGLPALGLAMEKVDPGVMERAPRKKSEGIITGRLAWVMALQGAVIALCTLLAFSIELYYLDADAVKARTVAFTVLVLCQKFHVYNCRSEWRSAFSSGFFSNMMLNASVLVIFSSQLLLLYVPALQAIFKVTALNLTDWIIVFAASIQPLLLMEMIKLMRPRRNPGRAL
ncbi:MAG: cation-translocating P-type ATPase [Deltaproteobacteria bacterium]